nr:hypothetical protein [Tanacetum cinerariifolium]
MHRGIAWDKVENLNPQVLQSFEQCTPLVTYLEEVEDIIGIPIEVEPLEETPLEDLRLNTCNHDLPLSSREVPISNKPDPQPQPLPNYPSLDASLGNERGLKPPMKPHSLDSFKMKALDNLTIHTPPSSLVASFHLRDLYCYYHPCLDNPKKHLLEQSGSLGIYFLNMEMIENDWDLESKEASFLGRGLNLPV